MAREKNFIANEMKHPSLRVNEFMSQK